MVILCFLPCKLPICFWILWYTWQLFVACDILKGRVSFSCPVLLDSLPPHGLQPTRHFCPRNFPGKDTGVGCHFFLRGSSWPRGRTRVSYTAGRFFTDWATRIEAMCYSFFHSGILWGSIKCLMIESHKFLIDASASLFISFSCDSHYISSYIYVTSQSTDSYCVSNFDMLD